MNFQHGGAGVYQFPPGTEGLISLDDDGLLVLHPDGCRLLRTPSDVDPHGVNPNAPAAIEAMSFSSANSIVARVLAQSATMFEVARNNVEIDQIAFNKAMYEITMDLLRCEKAYKAIAEPTREIVGRLERAGPATQQGGRVALPTLIPELEDNATDFLVYSKRAIGRMSKLAARFMAIEESDSNFQKLYDRLIRCGHGDSRMAQLISLYKDSFSRIHALRNYQEHPGDTGFTIIENVRVQPDHSLKEPTWRVVGMQSQPESAILSEMYHSLDAMIVAAEEIVLHGTDNRKPDGLRLILREYAVGERRQEMPIRFEWAIGV